MSTEKYNFNAVVGRNLDQNASFEQLNLAEFEAQVRVTFLKIWKEFHFCRLKFESRFSRFNFKGLRKMLQFSGCQNGGLLKKRKLFKIFVHFCGNSENTFRRLWTKKYFMKSSPKTNSKKLESALEKVVALLAFLTPSFEAAEPKELNVKRINSGLTQLSLGKKSLSRNRLNSKLKLPQLTSNVAQSLFSF